MIASFQEDQPGLDHADPMPDGSPRPTRCRPRSTLLGGIDHPVAKFWTQEAAFDVRHVDGSIYLGPPAEATGQQAVWFRARGPLPDDQLLHRALLAYACDQVMLEPILRRAGQSWVTPRAVDRSLDHAMWWHRDVASTSGCCTSSRRRARRAAAGSAPRGCSRRTGRSSRRSPRRAWSASRTDALAARTATPPGDTARMVRLRRVRIDAPGWSRRRAGRGFVYLDLDRSGSPTRSTSSGSPRSRSRPRGATCGSARGPTATSRRPGSTTPGGASTCTTSSGACAADRLKHDHVLEVARRLPAARRRVRADLALDGHAAREGARARVPAARPGVPARGRRGVRAPARLVRARDAAALARARPGARERRRPRPRAPELPRQVRPGAGHGGRGRRRRDARAHADPAARRRRRAARLARRRRRLARRDQRRRRRLRQGAARRRRDARRTSARGTRPCSPPAGSPTPARRRPVGARPHARRHRRWCATSPTSSATPRRVPRVVHRPARDRPVGAGHDDPRRPGRRPSPSGRRWRC